MGDQGLYWTCNGCDADYDQVEMDKAMHRTADDVIILVCTVCGRVGDFRDGPDCLDQSGNKTGGKGYFLVTGDNRIAEPNRETREARPIVQGRVVQGG